MTEIVLVFLAAANAVGVLVLAILCVRIWRTLMQLALIMADMAEMVGDSLDVLSDALIEDDGEDDEDDEDSVMSADGA